MINPDLPKPTKEMWGQCVPGLASLEDVMLENRMHAFVMRALEYDLRKARTNGSKTS